MRTSLYVVDFQVTLSFLNESVYRNMAPLFIGPVDLLVSKEPKAKEMLSTLRASPQITLLGTFVGWKGLYNIMHEAH